MSIESELRKYVGEIQQKPEVLTFSEYLEKVKKNPRLASRAHKRVFDMISSYGVEVDEETGVAKYKFFESELFGIEDSTKEIMEYFKGASLGAEVGKRFLLMFGPPASGKSCLLTMVKRGMEEWSKTEQGAMYAIEGCPMNEEPLNAIPVRMRPEVEKELGVKIEGTLCPVCAHRLSEELHGDFLKFSAKRFFMSEAGRKSIGTFCPSDPKTQDISELIGSIDLSKVGDYGSESHPLAFKFDGELNIANRGLVEFIEILKCLKGDSYVNTKNGLLRMDEISAVSELPYSRKISMDVQGKDEITPASHVIYKGKGATCRIITSKGFEVEGASDHRILVLFENGEISWKELEKINKHDVVCIKKEIGCWPNLIPTLNEYSDNIGVGSCRNMKKIPDKLTPELTRLLGYFVSEGWFLGHDRGIGICNQDSSIIEDLKTIGKSLEIPVRTNNKVHWLFHSVRLAKLFRKFGLIGNRAKHKHVPKIIRSAPKEMVSSFLRAYFDGDGTVGGLISSTTASPRLAKEIQCLLLNFGILSKHGRVYNKDYRKWYHTVEIDSENVEKFSAEIGFGIPYKARKMAKLAKESHVCHRDGLPNLKESWASLSALLKSAVPKLIGVPYSQRVGVRQMIGNMNSEQLWRFSRGITVPSKRSATSLIKSSRNFVKIPTKITEALESGFYFDKVESKTVGSSELWDLCVPKGHSYVANGFVNHNCDEKFLYVLLTATQEHVIKTPRYPLIHVDEVIMSHTNESEYKDFMGNPKNEALIDRMIVCEVKYNLRVDDEVRIYEKLFRQGDTGDIHIAPHTFRVAAIFAILTRLEEPKDRGLDVVKKMKLYNEEDVEGFSRRDIPRLKRDTPREGMSGISPRFVIDRLVTTAIRVPDGTQEDGKPKPKYVTPIEALRAMKDGLGASSKFKPEERERFNNFLQLAKVEFDGIARNEVQKAFFVSFEEEASTMVDNYIDNIEAYLEKTTVEDPVTKEDIPPDEKLMRSIETKIGISEDSKDSFRNEIIRKVATATRAGQKFRYQDHARLREAIEKELFEDKRDVIKMTISSRTKKDPKQLKRINEVIKTLCDEHGYIPESANDLLKYVSSMMSREK